MHAIGAEKKLKDKFVSYLEDDITLPKDWLTKVISVIDKKPPVIFGAPYLPYCNSPKPKWDKDSYGTFYGCEYKKQQDLPLALICVEGILLFNGIHMSYRQAV